MLGGCFVSMFNDRFFFRDKRKKEKENKQGQNTARKVGMKQFRISTKGKKDGKEREKEDNRRNEKTRLKSEIKK